MIKYEIISTGSQGNAVVIEDNILIDCGVSYKLIRPYADKLKLVLLTHIHSDHFNKSSIRSLARDRPLLRFGCCGWLVPVLVDMGISKRRIDVFEYGKMYGYGICNLIPVPLKHNVPNCGYKLHFADKGKMIYATDTNNLNGVTARNYDLYMIEANHTEADIKERIAKKKIAGEYAYEIQAEKNHLSKEKCDDFIYRNIGPNGVYVYMHTHRERDTTGDNDRKDT